MYTVRVRHQGHDPVVQEYPDPASALLAASGELNDATVVLLEVLSSPVDAILHGERGDDGTWRFGST